MSVPFYILSVDGGGYRGLFAAHLLKRMEEEFQIDWQHQFGLMAGTSTGSILAAALAYGVSATRVTELYKSHGQAIFRPRARSRFDILNITTSKYSSKYLKDLLDDMFEYKTLGDISVPLIIPSVDIGNGCVHVLKSSYHNEFVRDKNVFISDAILGSCATPTYFNPHTINNTYQLADGGLWANNPSLLAVIDANYRLNIPFENIRVLSIGTGKSTAYYPRSHGKWKDRLVYSWKGWGFATRWEGRKLIDLILNLQSDKTHNTLCLLMGESPLDPSRVLRLTFESDQELPMDSAEKRNDWIAKADQVFTHYSPKIKKLLSIEGTSN